MVIYEVNLTINNDIYHSYYEWLIKHIEIMLGFDGFCKATIFKESNDELNQNTTKLTIHYHITANHYLDFYLHTHAKSMREEGITQFGNQFTASRRIFSESFNLIKKELFNGSQ